MILQALSCLDGVSGCEDEVRAYVIAQVEAFCDSLTVDNLGNLIVYRKGTGSQKVMVCAHMDEVGLIVHYITDEGYLKFKTVGGIDPRILPGKRVRIGTRKVPGVIGVKAVHLTKPDERKKVLEVEELTVDIGASNRQEAETLVSIGDYAAFDSEFRLMGDGLVKGKALDDRAGCAALIGILRQNKRYSFDLYACFSVQEEVGLRGARVLARRICPDVALAVDVTTCIDLADVPSHETVTQLGKGPVLSVRDGSSYSSNRYRALMEKLCHEHGILVQLKKSTAGGNDAGALQLYGQGTQTLVLSLACRYLHSPSSVLHLGDFEGYEKLIGLFLENADKAEGGA